MITVEVWLDPDVRVGPPLAVLPVRSAAGSLELQLLGASHRAVVRGPEIGAVAADVALVETVACLVGGATVLPREKAAALLTYVSACVVNFFVPSGGAQWAGIPHVHPRHPLPQQP